MSIMDKVKNMNFGKSKEALNSGIQSGKKLLIAVAFFATFIGGFVLGARVFETGGLSSNLKGANVTVSGLCKLSDGQDRLPALVDDEVQINAIDKEAGEFSGTIRKTRESIVCKTSVVSFTALPLLSKWGQSPVAVPELTAAVVVKKEDPYWKMYEKKSLVISGTCRSADGGVLSNFVDEKVEVVSTTGIPEEPGQFTLTGLKRSDAQSVICHSKLITYRIFDPATDIKEVKDVPVDFTGKVVMVDSKCLPDPKYLKERKIDPKTKKPIGRVPKFYNLLNTPVQVLDYKMNDKKQITYLEGKIVDRSSDEAYGKKVICDSQLEKLSIKFDDSNTALLNKKGEDVSSKDPVSNLEVVSDGEVEAPVKVKEEVVEPAVMDENKKIQDLLKDLEK